MGHRRDTTELEALAAYERWAPGYHSSGHNPLTEAAEALLDPLLPPLVGVAALDLACGLGRWSRRLLEAGAAACMGIDFSPAMIRAAGSRSPSLELCIADMNRLPVRDVSADLAVLALGLSHVAKPAPVLGEIARVLKPGGWLGLVDLHPDVGRRRWRRSFRDPRTGDRLEVRWHVHALDSLREACEASALDVVALETASLDPDRLPAGAPAGATDGPALYAIVARKRKLPTGLS